jgi:hypothetical protein
VTNLTEWEFALVMLGTSFLLGLSLAALGYVVYRLSAYVERDSYVLPQDWKHW